MALLLTRKINQRIMIGDDISVCFIKRKGDQITFAINAQRQVSVRREEIYRKIARHFNTSTRNNHEENTLSQVPLKDSRDVLFIKDKDLKV